MRGLHNLKPAKPVKPMGKIEIGRLNAKKVIFKRRYTATTIAEKTCITILRHGSLTDLSKVYRTFPEVGQIMKISPLTCRKVVIRYRERGNFLDLKTTAGRPRTQYSLPSEVSEYLLSSKTLIELSTYSLQARCLLIQEKFGWKMDRWRLSKFYKNNRIACRTRSTVSHACYNNPVTTNEAHLQFVK